MNRYSGSFEVEEIWKKGAIGIIGMFIGTALLGVGLFFLHFNTKLSLLGVGLALLGGSVSLLSGMLLLLFIPPK